MPDSDNIAATFTLAGPLTLGNAQACRDQLLEGMAGSDRLRIGCPEDAEVDISFVQLLIAARRSGREAGKSVRLAAPASGVLLDTVRRLGLLDGDAAERAFWTAGEEGAA